MNLSFLTSRWNRLSFRLPTLIAVFAAATGIVAGAISYYVAHMSYVDSAKDRMELVRNERSRAVTTFINDTRIGLASLSTRPGLARDLDELSHAFTTLDDQHREAVIAAYTTGNPFPEGSRSALEDAGDKSGYTDRHKLVHEALLRMQQIKELHDLLLVDARGNIVYSVAKEADFGTNLLSGPYRDTNAAKVFRAALAAQPPWEQSFADMEPYGPSGHPAVFMGQAVRNSAGTVAGVMLFQLNNDKIRDFANHIQDLGDTGEVYLVGPDATRRSQTRFSHGELMTEKLDTESATRAAAGFSGSGLTTDYKGDDVVSAYAPIDLMGVRWGIVSKINLDEELAPLNTMLLATGAGVLLATLLIALLGYVSARRISRPLDRSLRVMEKLSRGDLHVEFEEGNGVIEIRQISTALQAFRGNLVETERLVSEVTKSQEQLTSLLDSSPTGILVISAENEVLFINDPGASILGRHKANFLGETFSFADIAVAEYEASRMIITARRDGFVKDAQFAVRISEKGELTLSLSARRTVYKGKEAYLIWFSDITESLRANKEFKELSGRFIALLENTPDIISIKGADLRYEAASQSVARLSGQRSWRDMIGKTAAEIWRTDAPDLVDVATTDILSGKLAESHIEEEYGSGADKQWYALRRVPMKDERNAIVGVLTLGRDITEQRRLREEIEKALTQAKSERARTDAILAGAPDPIIIVRSDSVIEYVNDQVTKVLGYTPAEIVGQRIEKLIPKRFHAGHSSQVRGFFETGEIRQMGAGRALFALTKAGKEIPVEIALSPIKSGGKSVVVALVRDITAQEAAAAQIKYSNMMSDSALELTTAGYWRIDYADPDYYVSSERTAAMFGELPKADWRYNLNDEWMSRIVAADPEAAAATAKKYDAALVGTVPFYDAIYPYKRPRDGKVIWTRAIGKIERDKSGKPRFMYGVNQDITHIKEAEAELEKAKQVAETATKAKSDFLASMSHEIRTPMNGVTGMADLLAQTSLDDEQRHMVRTIRESGNALITVINDILDFSKIEAGKLDLENVTMSVGDAVEGVASTLTPNAAKKGVRIQVFVDPKLPAAVHGDPTRLRQILFNLGGNAVKFSDGKDIEIRAGLAGKSDDDRTWLRFSVIDHGIGISKANQAKLFQAFSQAESSTTRRFGGTGLGLAICKRLTEMMGGTIGVDSREGHGSTFWVELPFEAAAGAKSNQKERDLHGLRVLLVGSGGPRAEAIDAYLRHWGAEVSAAPDADAALAVLSGKTGDKVDSVMIDLGLDGDRQNKALAVLRKAAKKTPLIVLQDYQNRGARIVDKHVVAIDANPLIRYRVVSAVAVAAGRASPEIKSEDDAAKISHAKAPTVDEARQRGQLILLAEDNLTNQDVIRRQLNLVGYTCELANNGVEALKAFKTGRYALLLTDCHMPEMDGYELTGSIRDMEQGTGVRLPIIAVTANALQGEAERCLAAGMDDYVSKPIAMPALVAALKKWMPPPQETTRPANGKRTKDARGPAVDERAIKDTFGDDDATFKEILQSFVEPSQAIIVEIAAAHQQRAAAGIKDAAHKLKSSARSIGANALADICVALETAGKAADWPAIDTLAPKARDEFGEVALYISKL